MNSSLTQMQFLSTLRYIAFFAGNWLATHKYIQDTDVQTIITVVLLAGPPAWAYVDNYLKSHASVAREAAAVQAGIELVTQGKALASDGTVITVSHDPTTTPPKPVTIQSAQEIVKEFAPPPTSIPKV